MSDEQRPSSSDAVTPANPTGARDASKKEIVAGFLFFGGTLAVAMTLYLGLAWVVVTFTPIANWAWWLAWPVSLAVSAFLWMGMVFALMLFLGRNYKGN